jgi:hypothetical protein
VQSGTVATSVRVTATIAGTTPAISTQSDQLVVTTGIADQNSMSLSAETLNPEAFDYDGESVPVMIRLADHFNNPVPDGTAVVFTTEGGSIEGSCTTTKGACTVNWVSQDPRPANGRATLLASAVGTESFVDSNGNGVFDALEPFDDLPEAFRDDDEDCAGLLFKNLHFVCHDTSLPEEFLDFNINGQLDAPDGQYNGVLCDPAVNSECSPIHTLHVRASLVLVMSGSKATINITPDPIIASAGSVPVTVKVSDDRGQPMPAGTTISVETSNGSILGRSSVKVPSTNFNGPLSYTFFVEKDTTPSSGTFTVTVTTPKGLISTESATVND